MKWAQLPCQSPDCGQEVKAELRRVLKPGGRLIVSVDHPFAIVGLQREAGHKPDYFATCNWTKSGPWAARPP